MHPNIEPLSLGEIFWEFGFLCKDLLVWMIHSALFKYWCQSWDFPLGSITGFSCDMLFLKFMCYGTAFIMLCVFVKSWFHILLLTTVMSLPNYSSQILKLFWMKTGFIWNWLLFFNTKWFSVWFEINIYS